MQITFSKNYIKIYIWQGISFLLNMLSMFIVIPYLTIEPDIFGIYSVCISLSIYLAYADLGFLGAGQKYAAEYYSKGQIHEEQKIIGFTSFILLILLIILSIIFLVISYYPEFLINNFSSVHQQKIASNLLFILAIFTPVTFLQRLLQIIFCIRLEEYLIQRINVIANLLKIASVLWFFKNNDYNIIGYFLFIQIANLIATLITMYIAKLRYNYDFISLFKSLRFNKLIFLKTKPLAYTSIYLTFTWIIYYELDSIVISNVLGSTKVAVFAIGLTMLTFFRNIFGILFSPFNSRFNHFIGQGDDERLKSLYLQIVTLLAPMVVLPIVAFLLCMSPLIGTWVGNDYVDSIEIAQYLILCNIFAFITYPTGMLLMAKERLKEMYIINSIIPLVFWLGIVLTFPFVGLKSFAIFKLIAFGISAIVYYSIMLKFLEMEIINSINKIFKPLIFPLLFVIISSVFIRVYLPIEKSKQNLFIVMITIISIISLSFLMQISLSKKTKKYLFDVIKK